MTAPSNEPGSDSDLTAEEIYGLYTSWWALKSCPAESPKALWVALTAQGIGPGKNAIAMTGPAAADYILSSAPTFPGCHHTGSDGASKASQRWPVCRQKRPAASATSRRFPQKVIKMAHALPAVSHS